MVVYVTNKHLRGLHEEVAWVYAGVCGWVGMEDGKRWCRRCGYGRNSRVGGEGGVGTVRKAKIG